MRKLASGYAPFDHDVAKGGAYQYTDGSRLSARLANERYTRMILSAVDFSGKTVVDVGSGDGTYTAGDCQTLGGKERSWRGARRRRPAQAAETHKSLFDPGSPSSAAISRLILRQGTPQHFDIAVYRRRDSPCTRSQGGDRTPFDSDTLIVLEPNGWNLMMKLVEKPRLIIASTANNRTCLSDTRRSARQAGCRTTA